MQTIKYFSILIGILVLVSCSAPTKNNSTATDEVNSKDSCCYTDTVGTENEIVTQCEITCPKCGHKKMETMPTDVCLIKYTCEKCDEEMRPKSGDCCVFCTHGTHKCPSMQ